MELREAKRIMDDHLLAMRHLLYLNDWKINLKWGSFKTAHSEGEFEVLAQCSVEASYKQASIEVDHTRLHDEEDLLRVIRHELLHLFHADLNLYRDQTREMLGARSWNAVEAAWLNGVERLVLQMEAMLDNGLGLDARGMLRKCKSHKPKPSRRKSPSRSIRRSANAAKT